MYFKKCLARSSIKRDSKKRLQISKIECTRSLHSTLQNRYLWDSVYGTITKEVWENTEHVHRVIRLKFLIDKSKKHPYIRSTTKLRAQEFTEYIEKVRNFVAPCIYIPTAEERGGKANGFLDDDIEEWHTECL